MPCRIFFLVLMGWLLISPPPSYGQDNVESELKALDREVANEKQRLEKQRKKQQRAQKELNKNKREINRLNKNLESLGDKEARLRKEIKRIETREIKLKSKLKQHETRLNEILKQSYINGITPDNVLSGAEKQNQQARVVYLRKISIARAELINNIQNQLDELKSLKKNKLKLNAELRKTKKNKSKQKSRVEKKRRQNTSTINKTSSLIKQSEKAIRDNQKRINALFSKLQKQRSNDLKNTDLPNANHSAKPFKSLRGNLRLPTIGKITAKFNQNRPGSDVPWEGVFISSKLGEKVKAVANGRVVYSDWLRGFGNLIILDHGGGYYSLYGNNESIWVTEGDNVIAGDRLGTVGNSGGHKQDGVYFEIRFNGRPIDPLTWVKIGT